MHCLTFSSKVPLCNGKAKLWPWVQLVLRVEARSLTVGYQLWLFNPRIPHFLYTKDYIASPLTVSLVVVRFAEAEALSIEEIGSRGIFAVFLLINLKTFQFVTQFPSRFFLGTFFNITVVATR